MTKIVKVFHKTLDPLSMFAYGTSTYEYLGVHSVPHAALAGGVGAALTTVARIGEYYLNRTPVDKVARATSKADRRIAKIQAKELAKKQPVMKELNKLEKRAKNLAKKSGESTTELDDRIKALKAQITAETAPADIHAEPTVGVNAQPTPVQPASVQFVGERHKH